MEHMQYNPAALVWHAWLDSLNLLKWQNFKLLFLVTIKAALETYRTLFAFWWWLVAAWAFFEWRNYMVGSSIDCFASFLLRITLFLVLMLTVRPSVMLKNYEYYARYGYYIFGYLFLLMGAYAILSSNILLLQYFVLLPNHLMYACPFGIIALMFFLDTDGAPVNILASLWRGFKLFIYNYPFIVAIFVPLAFGLHIFGFLLRIVFIFMVPMPLNNYCAYIVAAGLIPFLTCFWANLYTKKVHDQYSLYA